MQALWRELQFATPKVFEVDGRTVHVIEDDRAGFAELCRAVAAYRESVCDGDIEELTRIYRRHAWWMLKGFGVRARERDRVMKGAAVA
jgi:hypothetical protein